MAAILTEEMFSDREIGTSKTFMSEHRSVVVAVGNDLESGSEIARRAVLVQLNPVGPDPLTGDDTIADLPGWTSRHRDHLLAVLIGLVKAEKAAGHPESTRCLPACEHWSAIVGGILEANGVKGFLENHDMSWVCSDAKWLAFFSSWHGQCGGQPVRAAELMAPASEAGLLAPRENALSLGLKPRARAGSLYNGFQIFRVGPADNPGLSKLTPQSNADRVFGPKVDTRSDLASLLK